MKVTSSSHSLLRRWGSSTSVCASASTVIWSDLASVLSTRLGLSAWIGVGATVGVRFRVRVGVRFRVRVRVWVWVRVRISGQLAWALGGR